MNRITVVALLLLACPFAGVRVPVANGQSRPTQDHRPAEDQTRPAAAQPPEPTTGKAEALLGAGRIDEALNTLQAIPRTSSNEPLINHLLGLAYYQKSDYARAIQLLGMSASATPDSSRQHRQAIRLIGMS